MADVVDSTHAIRAGDYKSVNLAGAAVIAAIQNAVGSRELPFVFGGDGALVALAPGEQEIAGAALAALRTWSSERLALELRAALVPVADVRAAGHDVRAARFRVSGEVAYAMFSGGGANWADREMKAGRFLITPAPPGAQPDLTGLSCRFLPMRARSGAILSIIALPREGADLEAFGALVAQLVELLAVRGARRPPGAGRGPAGDLAAPDRWRWRRASRRRAAGGCAPARLPCSSPASRSSPRAPAGRSSASTRGSTTPTRV